MIIRRKHTANFTTIGNALFADNRLSLDELGLLCFLLSKPHDWEVRRMALRRQFKIGRDGMRRMFRNLIQRGWVVAEVTRMPDGRISIIYQVRDEPGPELTAEEAKAALSLVSSGAGHGASDHDSDDGDDADPPRGLPTEGRPAGGGQPPPANPPPAYIDSTKTDSVKTESTNRARAFCDVKAIWPSENLLSEAMAQGAFGALTAHDRADCVAGIRPYLDDCRAQGRKVCDLRTFIEQRRWERFKPKAEAPTLFVIKVDTDQWRAWRVYLEATGGDVAAFDRMGRNPQYGGKAMPSEWPPAAANEKPNNLRKQGEG